MGAFGGLRINDGAARGEAFKQASHGATVARPVGPGKTHA